MDINIRIYARDVLSTWILFEFTFLLSDVLAFRTEGQTFWWTKCWIFIEAHVFIFSFFCDGLCLEFQFSLLKHCFTFVCLQSGSFPCECSQRFCCGQAHLRRTCTFITVIIILDCCTEQYRHFWTSCLHAWISFNTSTHQQLTDRLSNGRQKMPKVQTLWIKGIKVCF